VAACSCSVAADLERGDTNTGGKHPHTHYGATSLREWGYLICCALVGLLWGVESVRKGRPFEGRSGGGWTDEIRLCVHQYDQGVRRRGTDAAGGNAERKRHRGKRRNTRKKRGKVITKAVRENEVNREPKRVRKHNSGTGGSASVKFNVMGGRENVLRKASEMSRPFLGEEVMKRAGSSKGKRENCDNVVKAG